MQMHFEAFWSTYRFYIESISTTGAAHIAQLCKEREGRGLVTSEWEREQEWPYATTDGAAVSP
jgi:hypothetical protein